MPTTHIHFIKSKLVALPIPPEKSQTYHDTKEKGLCLIVSYGGSKTFYLYKKIHGKPKRFKIGSFPDVSVEQARHKALAFKNEIFQGVDPKQKEKSLRQEITFKELFDLYMERHSKPHKKSWRYDEREVNLHLSHWFNRQLSTINRQDIKTLHDGLYATSGLYQANHILRRLRAMYNKAIEWGWDGTNPTQGIKLFKEKARDRFLQPEELIRLFTVLNEDANADLRDFIYLSLFTGARKGNVLAMRWEDINLETAQWHVKNTKNGENMTLPLMEEAVVILEARKLNTTSTYVFPSASDATQHLKNPKKSWQRIRKLASIDDIRLHDLRRTMGSYQAISGSSLLVIGKSLGHKSQQATAIYSRLTLDPVKQSMQNAVREMTKGLKK